MERSLSELQLLIDHENVDNDIKVQAKGDIEKLKSAIEYYDWLNRLVDSLESKKYSSLSQKITKKGDSLEVCHLFF